mmetsp:Transcript_398/g.651  ORF Transcript_398/g.651 Transcript_398/m.651 type:complete len:437 (+) Transcript_398:3-1313(+)
MCFVAEKLSADTNFLPMLIAGLTSGFYVTKYHLCSILAKASVFSRLGSSSAVRSPQIISPLVAISKMSHKAFIKEVVETQPWEMDVIKPMYTTSDLNTYGPAYVERLKEFAMLALRQICMACAPDISFRMELMRKNPSLVRHLLKSINRSIPPLWPESNHAGYAADALSALSSLGPAFDPSVKTGLEPLETVFKSPDDILAIVKATETLLTEDPKEHVELLKESLKYRLTPISKKDVKDATVQRKEMMLAVANILANLAESRSFDSVLGCALGVVQQLYVYTLTSAEADTMPISVFLKGVPVACHFHPTLYDSCLRAVMHLAEVHPCIDKRCVSKQALMERSADLKTKGNYLFKQGDHSTAVYLYTTALGLCSLPVSDNEAAVIISNRAECYLQLRDFQKALADAQRALKLSSAENPVRPKMLNRRDRALSGLKSV